MTLADLRAAAYLGFLKPDDLVRDPSTETWVEAATLVPLRSVFPGGGSHPPSDPSTDGMAPPHF
jgi:hypothetical protein